MAQPGGLHGLFRVTQIRIVGGASVLRSRVLGIERMSRKFHLADVIAMDLIRTIG